MWIGKHKQGLIEWGESEYSTLPYLWGYSFLTEDSSMGNPDIILYCEIRKDTNKEEFYEELNIALCGSQQKKD